MNGKDGKITVMHFVSGLKAGGVEQVVYNYCSNMNRAKLKFLIVYQHNPAKDCIDKLQDVSDDIVRITARSENFIGNIVDSYKVIKRYKPDIIHAHMNLMNFCPMIAGIISGVRVRISHSHIFEVNRNIFYKLCALVFKFMVRIFSNVYLTCGYEAGEYLYGKKMMLGDKVHFITNAIDIDSFRRNKSIRTVVRKKLDLEQMLVVGNVGRLSKQKNQIRLIDIFAVIKKKKDNARLLLIGTGELENELHEKVRQKGLEQYVIFYGTSNQMCELYNAMDVFVLPSLFEGFPVVSVEVQAAGVPGVISDTVDSRIKMTEGIVFYSLNNDDADWADKIIEVSSDKIEFDYTELIKNYDIKCRAKELEDLYLQAFNGKK